MGQGEAWLGEALGKPMGLGPSVGARHRVTLTSGLCMVINLGSINSWRGLGKVFSWGAPLSNASNHDSPNAPLQRIMGRRSTAGEERSSAMARAAALPHKMARYLFLRDG